MFHRRRVHWYHKLLTVTFLVLILLPGVDMIVGIDKSPVAGQVAEFPEFRGGLRGIASFPGQFKYWFGENFGFRQAFIRVHGKTKAGIFKTSPSKKVLLGQDGWLYYLDERVFEDYRNLYPFDDAGLKQWLDLLEQRRAYCAERDITYLFTISPNKPSIYPEFLPPGREPLDRPKRLDQLQKAVNQRLPEVAMVDVRDALRENKRSYGPLYFNTDTHWNEMGAYVAYVEIMTELKKTYPDLVITPLDQIEVREQVDNGGDLARMIGLKFSTEETMRTPVFPQPRKVVREKDGSDLTVVVKDVLKGEEGLVTLCENGEIESAVIIHDSFGQALIPLLARHFKRATFVWSNSFDKALVEKEQPKVVIQQLVERRLLNWTPEPE